MHKQASSLKTNETSADARENKRTNAAAAAQPCGAPVQSAHGRRPERRKTLFCGLVCGCPCGCASRTTAASQEQPLLASDGTELCSECFRNIWGDTKNGTLCRVLAMN